MNSAAVETEFIGLICYLISSARGLVSEPALYGPSRLVEAARRLIHLAGECGIRHARLDEVAGEIEERRVDALMQGDETFVQFLDDLVALLATWLADTGLPNENSIQ